jgi:hypothetical protein
MVIYHARSEITGSGNEQRWWQEVTIKSGLPSNSGAPAHRYDCRAIRTATSTPASCRKAVGIRLDQQDLCVRRLHGPFDIEGDFILPDGPVNRRLAWILPVAVFWKTSFVLVQPATGSGCQRFSDSFQSQDDRKHRRSRSSASAAIVNHSWSNP